MPKVVVEVNGKVVETYNRVDNRVCFQLAKSLSERYAKVLMQKDEYAIYVETMETRNFRRGFIVQMDLDGTRIGCYDSSVEAAKVTGVPRGNIVHACRGRLKKAGGFKWKRVG